MIIKTKMKCPFRDDEQCIGFACPHYYMKKWDYGGDRLTFGGCRAQNGDEHENQT